MKMKTKVGEVMLLHESPKFASQPPEARPEAWVRVRNRFFLTDPHKEPTLMTS